MRTKYSPLIHSTASSFNLDGNLIEAIVIQESDGNTHAYRFEPQFWARYLAKLPQWATENPQRVSASYGLMQLMYTTAVELGYDLPPESLFVPEINLRWGCMKVRQLWEWADQVPNTSDHARLRAVLASYNGGMGGNSPDAPLLRDGKYANAVLHLLARLRALPPSHA